MTRLVAGHGSTVMQPVRSAIRWLAGRITEHPLAGPLLLLFVLGPITYGAGGLLGLSAGVVGWTIQTRREGLARGLVFGIGLGLGAGLARNLDSNPLWALFLGLTAGLAWALVPDQRVSLRKIVSAGIWGGVLIAVGVGLLVSPAWGAGLGGGEIAGAVIGSAVRPGLLMYRHLWRYLVPMTVPIIGFVVAYLVIAVLFAGLFATIYRQDPSAFASTFDRSPLFGDFVFFSVMTLATLGYSPMLPTTPLAHLLVSLEAIVGVIWTLFVFAAIVEYLGPRFKRVGHVKDAAPPGSPELLVAVNELQLELKALRLELSLAERPCWRRLFSYLSRS